MKLLLKLILRDAWYHRARLALAVLATVAMTGMIVWLIGSLDLMVLRFDQDAENYLGYYQLALVPGKETDRSQTPGPLQDSVKASPFPETVLDELRSDKIVVQITPARYVRNLMGKMLDPNDTDAALRRERSNTGIPAQSPALIGIDTLESPFEIKEGRWFQAPADSVDAPEVIEGVIGTAAARSLREWGDASSDPVQVGDFVISRIGTRDFKIRIVGMVEQNLGTAPLRGTTDPAVGAVYVSIKNARQMGTTDGTEPARIDFIYLRLREGANTKQFEETWTKHLARKNIDMKFLDVDKIQSRLNQTKGRSSGGLMGGAASLNSMILFATFVSALIVFTTLSMGVTERAREFAMLRTVGMPRYKIACLVLGESLMLGVSGWLGGMTVGWLILQISVWMQPEMFGTGKTVSLGITPILVSALAATIGTLLAAIFPAWRATRISPLEGMNRGYTHTISKRWFQLAALVGTVLLTINPVLVYHTNMTPSAEFRQFLYCSIGLPTQIAGCLLWTPMLILWVEKLLTPMIAKLLLLPKELLASQLSSNIWRTIGTTLALSVGLGLYSFLEISGYSMLVPYIQSKAIPNTLVTFLPSGLPPSEMDSVRNMPGVNSKRFLPIAVDQSHFSPRQSEQFMAGGLIRMQTSAVVFGIDIEKAFLAAPGESRPMIELPFQEGNLQSALEKLKTGGRYCLVPDSFAFRTNVHVGDKLELLLPAPPGDRSGPRGGEKKTLPKIVEYEICGVVSIHGWLWMNKISGVRKRGYRSGAMLLAPIEIVKQDYQISDAAYFWFDRTLNESGLPTVSDTELENSLQQLADRLAGETDGVSRPMVKVNSREYLLDRVGSRADEVIQTAAKMPLILLAISSFGMMGTIAASVRTRRFQFGVLRSLGVTRSGLVRLVLAEALLISLTVIAISLGFGLIGGWCFIGLMKYVGGFGGFTNPLTIPVYWLSIGFASTLVLCTLAALGPAVIAGHTEPTRLLQER